MSPRSSTCSARSGVRSSTASGRLRTGGGCRSTTSRRWSAATLENGLTYLEVIGEQGQPKIARIHVKVFAAAADAAATRTVFEQMLDRLPLVCTLRAALDLTIELILTP